MDSKKQKALIYTRRSQDRDDRQVLSIDGQKEQLSRLIEENNYAPFWLPPEERSAHKAGRPIFEDMCAKIESGEARVIVVWAANRLARNALDGGKIIHYLHTGQLLKIVTPGKTYSAASMEDQFFLQIEFGMSKMYSDEISKNVKRGYQTKYERGEYPTHAPVGYLNGSIGRHKNIYPDPVRASIVIETFRYASTGQHTLKEVWLHARDELGLTSKKGNPVTRQTINDMLQNITYTGNFKHGGGFHKGTYKPLIDKALYDRVQVAMGWAKGSKRSRNSTAGRSYPFKGPFTCAGCGHNITAYTKRKKLKDGTFVEYEYYGCTKKSKTKDCKEPQVTGKTIHKQVILELDKLEITKEECDLSIQLLKKFHKEHVANRNIMLEVWKKDAQDARRSMDRLLDLRLANEIDSDTFSKRKADYEDVLVRTKQLIDDSDTNAEAWLELAEEFFTNAKTLVSNFEQVSDEQQRELLLEIGSNWKLNNKKVLFTPRKPYNLLANRTKNTDWRTLVEELWNYFTLSAEVRPLPA